MVQTVAELDEAESPASSHRGTTVAIILVVVVGIFLGYMGWVLPSPGGSLITPTLIVFGTGAAIAIGSWLLASLRPQRRELWAFAIGIIVLTLTASVWTFQFSLPAHMAWDSTATPRAKAFLFGLNHGNLNMTVPSQPCTTVTTGSIGPLNAPYRQCPISTAEGHVVTFLKLGESGKGISFTDRGPDTFLDICYRHLVGQWYMFTNGGLTNPSAPCPFGYQFHGGP
jgi:hypothetical protein